MKKSKLLAGVLVASMALLGTGYAYWTDQLTVKTTVATGELNVKYVSVSTPPITGELKENSGSPQSSQPIEALKPSDLPAGATKLWDAYSTANYTCAKFKIHDGKLKLSDSERAKKYNFYGDIQFNLRPTDTNEYYWYKDEDKNDNIPQGWYTEGNRKGCFQTDPTCRYYTMTSPGTSGETIIEGSAGYINKYVAGVAEITADPFKGVNIGLNNFYPGSFSAVTFTAQNDGTIPAVIDYVEFNNSVTTFNSTTDLADLAKVLKVEITGFIDTKNEAGAAAVVPLKQVDGTMDQLASKLDEFYKGIRLEKDDKITTTFKIIFPGKEGKDENNVDIFENKSPVFGLYINWIQHNALTTAEKAE